MAIKRKRDISRRNFMATAGKAIGASSVLAGFPDRVARRLSPEYRAERMKEEQEQAKAEFSADPFTARLGLSSSSFAIGAFARFATC